MADFILDTSGAVPGPVTYPMGAAMRGAVRWSDIFLFEQGTIRRMLEEFYQSRLELWGSDENTDDPPAPPKFSDIHPETLAAIKKDCAEARKIAGGTPNGEDWTQAGRAFWAIRNSQTGHPSFPPLTPFLDDEGKVRLREAGCDAGHDRGGAS